MPGDEKVPACRPCYYGSGKGTCRNAFLRRWMGRPAGLALPQAEARGICQGRFSMVLLPEAIR